MNAAAPTIEMRETYEPPDDGWVCFHCGERFRIATQARIHFGTGPLAEPGCILKVKGRDKGLLIALRDAETEIAKLRIANGELENDASMFHGTVADLKRHFHGASSAFQAFLHLDSVQGRAIAAEATLRVLEAMDPGIVALAREEVCKPPGDAKPATPAAVTSAVGNAQTVLTQ